MRRVLAEKKRLLRKSKDELLDEMTSLVRKQRTKTQILEDIEFLESRYSKSKKVSKSTPNKIKFKKNSVIYNEGEEGEAVYIILNGQVEFRKNFKDKAPGVLARIGAGKMFGDCALYDNRPRAASAVAVKPTEAICITKDEFNAQLSTVNTAVQFVAQAMSERIRRLIDEMVQLKK